MNRISQHIDVDTFYDADFSGAEKLPADGTGWIDMSTWDGCVVIIYNISGSSYLSLFKIIGNSSSSGGSTDHDVVTLTNPTNINVAGETAMLEFLSSQMTDGDRYITASINSDSAEPCTVTFIRWRGRYIHGSIGTYTETAYT